MQDTFARVKKLAEITEADIKEPAANMTPQAGCLNEIIRLFPTLTLAAQEAVYLAVLAYASLACVC